MLERARGLSAPALKAIAELEARCLEADGGRLKLEWGELGRRDPGAVNDLLWWAPDGTLVGFCGRYAFGGETPEATGMVDPAHRGQGIGAALLDALRTLCGERGDQRVLLVTPRSCVTAKALAERAGGVFDHAEHALMLTRLVGDGASDPSMTLRRAVPQDAAAVRALLESGFGRALELTIGDDPDEPTYVAERDGRVIATMRVTQEPDAQRIYGFVVDPQLQGRGIGRDLLRRVCVGALGRGATGVHLEVSVDNDRALGLYTSVGFELETTEDYYALTAAASR